MVQAAVCRRSGLGHPFGPQPTFRLSQCRAEPFTHGGGACLGTQLQHALALSGLIVLHWCLLALTIATLQEFDVHQNQITGKLIGASALATRHASARMLRSWHDDADQHPLHTSGARLTAAGTWLCQWLSQAVGAGDVSQLLFLTYARRLVLSHNGLTGSLVFRVKVNYISGYVRICLVLVLLLPESAGVLHGLQPQAELSTLSAAGDGDRQQPRHHRRLPRRHCLPCTEPADSGAGDHVRSHA